MINPDALEAGPYSDGKQFLGQRIVAQHASKTLYSKVDAYWAMFLIMLA